MTALTGTIIDSWADDLNGPVALHLKQKLLPVEGEGAVIFPPTYADIGYNIDTLSDGTRVCTIDNVGSQANRIEPIFKASPYAQLVPNIEIELHTRDGHTEKRSLLDLAHRGADAVVLSSPSLAPKIAEAFTALRQRNDAMPICCIAPTCCKRLQAVNAALRGRVILISVNSPGCVSTSIDPECCLTMMS